MAVKHVAPRPGHSNAVHGLEHGRTHARRRSARRRMQNTITSGVMFVIVASVVGGAGYYLWEFYVDEQERNAPSGPVVGQRSASPSTKSTSPPRACTSWRASPNALAVTNAADLATRGSGLAGGGHDGVAGGNQVCE